MAWDSVPWFVGGGAEHSPEIARVLAYAAFSGAEGVVGIGDLTVRPLDVPGGSVRVGPGACAIRNRATGQAYQSYTGRNVDDDVVAIAPTGSSGGRSDLIVARVEDPYLAGEPWDDPTDPKVGPYVFSRVIAGVPDTTTTVAELGLGYSAIPLARIDLPASTATVEAAHITDLRFMANPRSLEVLRIHASLASDAGTTLNSTTSDGEFFPNAGGSQYIDVPEWAVRAQIEASWLNMPVASGGNPWGSMWVEYGPYVAPSRERSTQRFSYDTNAGTGAQRVDWHIADDVYVPPAYRGTNQGFTMYANLSPTYGGTVKPSLDARSGVVLRVKFLEQPDASSS